MKTAGIIAEYNPFHQGHAYHIEQTRQMTGADYIIVVLSGDFVQRGAPAFLPRQELVRMALEGGADLVFELPSTHSCTSAEFFAESGVRLLNGLGCVDFLSFGSEAGEISQLFQLADFLVKEPESYRRVLQAGLKSGLSFPAARQAALLECFPDAQTVLASPNNILGIEYCKALIRLQSPIRPVTVTRTGSGYHDTDFHQDFPSATAIRRHILQKPRESQCSEQYHFPMEEEDFSLLFRYLLLTTGKEQLCSIQDISRDLANRIYNCRYRFQSYGQFVSLLKTRELTYSRISRALFHLFMDLQQIPILSYARLLGFRRSAAPLLSKIKESSVLPIVTKVSAASRILPPEAAALLEQNIRISERYEAVRCEKYHTEFIHEFSRQLIIL